MLDPIVADIKPQAVALKRGEEYHYCRCGRTKNQPWCDGSHAGTGITPLAFTAEADGDGYICRCRQTGNPPYCDGAHSKVLDDRIGQELRSPLLKSLQWRSSIGWPEKVSANSVTTGRWAPWACRAGNCPNGTIYRC